MSDSSPDFYETDTPEDNVLYWFNEIDEAKKRDKEYHKEGKRLLGIYTSRDEIKVPYNIFYSNTDTLLPALYSSVPRPDIQRRFEDDDPIGKAVCDAGDRVLAFLLDTNMEGSQTIDECIRAAVFDALTVGRGVTVVKYDAEISEYSMDAVDSETDETDEMESTVEMSKESEYICCDSKEWNKIYFGFAKKWSKTPWLAFEEEIDKTEAIRLFGKDIANQIEFITDVDVGVDEEKGSAVQKEHKAGRKTATIYQIWDRAGGKKVRYISFKFKKDFLKVVDDPLNLTGFYPIPKPLQLVHTTDEMQVIPPYIQYENQALELNDITKRINRLVKAIKAKGIYDSELGSDIANLMQGEDNVFIPADKSAALAAQSGFENAIWFMPIQQMVTVLGELYQAREACKQVIYEVTGISDIIRGSTQAGETATAQSLKSQWGTLRLKRNQLAVQRYARDILRIALEIAATKFEEKTWAGMTQLPYATSDQMGQAQQVMQMAQHYQVIGRQPNDQEMQVYQQAQQTLQGPNWPKVLEALRNDTQRMYRIDIETNSTIIPEAIEDQQNIAEVMASLGSYLQGVTPLIQQGIFPFAAAKAMMMSIVRRFSFGSKIESYIEQMHEPPPPDPQPPPPDPTQGLMQIEQIKQQTALQKSQQDGQLELQKMESNRIIEQGRAATQMHLEQMRIESAERIAKFQTDIDAQTRLEIARINATTTAAQKQADIFVKEHQLEIDKDEAEKERVMREYDAQQEVLAKQFEANMQRNHDEMMLEKQHTHDLINKSMEQD